MARGVLVVPFGSSKRQNGFTELFKPSLKVLIWIYHSFAKEHRSRTCFIGHLHTWLPAVVVVALSSWLGGWVKTRRSYALPERHKDRTEGMRTVFGAAHAALESPVEAGDDLIVSVLQPLASKLPISTYNLTAIAAWGGVAGVGALYVVQVQLCRMSLHHNQQRPLRKFVIAFMDHEPAMVDANPWLEFLPAVLIPLNARLGSAAFTRQAAGTH